MCELRLGPYKEIHLCKLIQTRELSIESGFTSQTNHKNMVSYYTKLTTINGHSRNGNQKTRQTSNSLIGFHSRSKPRTLDYRESHEIRDSVRCEDGVISLVDSRVEKETFFGRETLSFSAGDTFVDFLYKLKQ